MTRDPERLNAEVRALTKKREFHHTSKHDSRFNLAEIECAMLANTCWQRRNGEEEMLKRVAANVAERNSNFQTQSVK